MLRTALLLALLASALSMRMSLADVQQVIKDDLSKITDLAGETSLLPTIKIITKSDNSPSSSLQDIPYPFEVCEGSSWKQESLKVNEKPGRNVNCKIEIIGSTENDIQFSYVELVTKLNGIQMDKRTMPFEQSYEAGDTIDQHLQAYIPGFIPTGNYVFTVNFYKKGGAKDGCVILTFKV